MAERRPCRSHHWNPWGPPRPQGTSARHPFSAFSPGQSTGVCVHDAGSGALIAQVDRVADRLVSWYDDDAFLIRNQVGGALSITVVDLLRAQIADIARSSDERDGDLRLFFARRP